MNAVRARLRLVGDDARLRDGWHCPPRPLHRAEPQKMTDINHFGLQPEEPLTTAMGRTDSKRAPSVGKLASVR